MLGSLLYTAIVSSSQKSSASFNGNGDSPLTLHAKLSSLVCAISALALAFSVASKDEQARFYAFCIFEACVGMYYPVQGTLRGTLISNEHRATVKQLFFYSYPKSYLFVIAFVTFPCPTQYLCRCLPSDRCFVNAQGSPHR